MASEKPNIVLVVADDLGYGDLSSYGSPTNRTPRIDSLGRDGARFTDFYMASSVCSPSRAAVMTGCYPKRVGLQKGDRATVLRPADTLGLSSEEITVAEILSGAGYATALIGKWHLGDQPEFLPTRHGFDRYYGLPYSNDMGPGHWQEDFPPLPILNDECIDEIGPHQSTLTHRYTDRCVSFIAEHRDRPFFLYLAHMYVHLPLFVPPEFVAAADNGEYGAAVECVDYSMGRILDALDRFGLRENTLVIFTSDNGSNGRDGGSNLPLRGFKGSTWEGGMRVPCLMRWPATVAPGEVVSEMTTAMDLLPTFAHLSGAALPRDRPIDGRRIPALCEGEPPSPEHPLFYYKGDDLEAVRRGRYKLSLVDGLLYDLSRDIGETTDIAEATPSVVRELTRLAEKCRDDLGDGEVRGTGCRKPGRKEAPRFIHDRPEFFCGLVQCPGSSVAQTMRAEKCSACSFAPRNCGLSNLSPALPCMAERMFSTELGCCISVLRERVVLMNFWSAILEYD
jgi:arylsulfatase A-like enzyme